jgi:hypothetical protein
VEGSYIKAQIILLSIFSWITENSHKNMKLAVLRADIPKQNLPKFEVEFQITVP